MDPSKKREPTILENSRLGFIESVSEPNIPEEALYEKISTLYLKPELQTRLNKCAANLHYNKVDSTF